MALFLVHNLFAVAALLPAALLPVHTDYRRSGPFWASAALAAVAACSWTAGLVLGGWLTEFGTALWVIVASSATLFLPLALLTRQGWRLAPLLMPFLVALAVLASVARGEAVPLNSGAPALLVRIHLVVVVLIFGLLTLAATASAAVFLQEQALKRKRPMAVTRLLPSVADAERLADRLLAASEIVLGLGLITGMAIRYHESGRFLVFDHKTLFSLAAFILIGLLMLGHRVCGVRGRIAARVVMIAYLLVILASPGVKFVTQVLL